MDNLICNGKYKDFIYNIYSSDDTIYARIYIPIYLSHYVHARHVGLYDDDSKCFHHVVYHYKNYDECDLLIDVIRFDVLRRIDLIRENLASDLVRSVNGRIHAMRKMNCEFKDLDGLVYTLCKYLNEINYDKTSISNMICSIHEDADITVGN